MCIQDLLPLIHKRMTERHLTQAELGQWLGVHQTGMSRRLSGRMPFRIHELGKLAELLDLTIKLDHKAPLATLSTQHADQVGQSVSLIEASLAQLSDKDRREFLLATSMVLEGKLRDPAKTHVCRSLRLLAHAWPAA